MHLPRWTFILTCVVAVALPNVVQAAEAPAVEPYRLPLAAPIKTWDEAVPLGNGLTGGLLWGYDNTINLSLDRGDLWDERLPEIYRQDNWSVSSSQPGRWR